MKIFQLQPRVLSMLKTEEPKEPEGHEIMNTEKKTILRDIYLNCLYLYPYTILNISFLTFTYIPTHYVYLLIFVADPSLLSWLPLNCLSRPTIAVCLFSILLWFPEAWLEYFSLFLWLGVGFSQWRAQEGLGRQWKTTHLLGSPLHVATPSRI